MNKDILKEYFEHQDSLDMTPRDEFKEMLISQLHCRINQYEQRQKCYSTLVILSAVLGAIVLIWYYLPTPNITMPIIETSPIYILLSLLLFIIIFIASYFINTMKLNELRRQLQALKP